MQPSTKPNQIYVPLFAVCVVVLAFSHESVSSMIELWQLSSYQHAWLIPLISLYLLWAGRSALDGAVAHPSVLAALIFVGAAWVWVVSRMTFVQAAEHLSIWAMLNAAAWAVLGWQVYRRLMIPMLFLFLALPIGTSLVPLLMEVTADIAGGLLAAAGVPAYREGMFFTLPGGSFVVADVCSGYRYFNAGLCISTLFAIFLFRTAAKAALYIVACAVFFVLINGVRAAIVMAVASTSDMRYLAGEDHILFGWVLFVLGMVLTYAIGWRFADTPEGRFAQ